MFLGFLGIKTEQQPRFTRPLNHSCPVGDFLMNVAS